MFFYEIGGIFPSISAVFRAISALRGISPLIFLAGYFLVILEDLKSA